MGVGGPFRPGYFSFAGCKFFSLDNLQYFLVTSHLLWCRFDWNTFFVKILHLRDSRGGLKIFSTHFFKILKTLFDLCWPDARNLWHMGTMCPGSFWKIHSCRQFFCPNNPIIVNFTSINSFFQTNCRQFFIIVPRQFYGFCTPAQDYYWFIENSPGTPVSHWSIKEEIRSSLIFTSFLKSFLISCYF